jgi:pimeloyl-ACP methyl ester carboxylesterase
MSFPMTRLCCLPLVLAALVGLLSCGSLSAADLKTDSFDSKGVKIAYFTQGKGEPVVLIHGLFASAGMNWQLPGISTALAKDYQVIAMDVRAHGLSDKPTKEEAYGPELVEDVVRLLDHLKIKKAHIVGYSMGGIIAANFTVKYPERVLSTTLGGMGWLKAGSLADLGLSQIGKNDPNAKPVAICAGSLAKLALTEEEIKSIKVPVTVLVGDKDELIEKLCVEPLQQVRKDWPVVTIKNANHITCVLQKQFKDEIVGWVKKNTKQ